MFSGAPAGPARLAFARLVDESEAALVRSLIVEGFADLKLDPPSSAVDETVEAIAATLAAGGGVIAELDGAPAGVALFKPFDDDLYLGRLAVPPAFRRRGVARAIIARIEAAAREHGCSAVRLNVRFVLAGNRRLFADCGYAPIGVGCHPGVRDPTYLILRKPV